MISGSTCPSRCRISWPMLSKRIRRKSDENLEDPLKASLSILSKRPKTLLKRRKKRANAKISPRAVRRVSFLDSFVSKTDNDLEQKLPGGYIPATERKDAAESSLGKNPQMEKLKLMSQMMNKRQKAAVPAPSVNSQPKKSGSSSSDISPLEESGPKLVKNGDLPSVRVSTGDKLDATGDARLARSSASSLLNAYPEHLSTLHNKSPVPSPLPEKQSSLSSSTGSGSRVRADSESSRKQSVSGRRNFRARRNSKSNLDTPRYCRNMVSKMLVTGFLFRFFCFFRVTWKLLKEQLRQESNLPYEMLKARHSSRLHVTCHLTIIYANYASFFMNF